MKILILGSGGREHALGWALKRERPDLSLLFCPGNGGTARLGRNLSCALDDQAGLASLARAERIDLTLVGPEAPLVAGLVDHFASLGLPIFGPTARAAAIEGSKLFAKRLLREHGIPTAEFQAFSEPRGALEAATRGDYPKVIKADGLAAGKGVVIAQTREEAAQAIAEMMERRALGAAGAEIVIERFLEGEEVSAFAIARDEEFRLLPLAQDHKRIGEGDTGPNTGGMGAYAPYLRDDPALRRRIEEEVLAPTLRALARAGRPFRGLLYAGLMVREGRPMVLEFNCRFGDPETQAVMPLLGAGFLDALQAVAAGMGPLPAVQVRAGDAAATVVLASAGYPGAYRTGHRIEGAEHVEELPETFLFHAGTRAEGGEVFTSGGRVMAVTGRGPNLKEALRRAYAGCSLVRFEGKTLRRDIGGKALA